MQTRPGARVINLRYIKDNKILFQQQYHHPINNNSITNHPTPLPTHQEQKQQQQHKEYQQHHHLHSIPLPTLPVSPSTTQYHYINNNTKSKTKNPRKEDIKTTSSTTISNQHEDNHIPERTTSARQQSQQEGEQLQQHQTTLNKIRYIVFFCTITPANMSPFKYLSFRFKILKIFSKIFIKTKTNNGFYKLLPSKR